jgi:glycosyltransferase involved in cell wall biosynthesis
MNILFTNFHPGIGGGHVTYILSLLLAMKTIHRLHVACPATSRLFKRAGAIQGVKAIDMSFTTRPSSWFSARAALRNLITKEKFDVIHVNGSSDHKQVMLALIGFRSPPRVVFTKHNCSPVNSFGHHLRAFFSTDHVIAVSDHVKNMLLQSPYKRRPISTIKHGVDIQHFFPHSRSDRVRLRAQLFEGIKNKIILGSSGGTNDSKGWFDLILAMSLIAPEQRERFHIVVMGEEPSESQRARLIDSGMSAHVSFPGVIDDVRAPLAACDVGFILSYKEALSFACREMMAMGLPVLVTQVGGLPESVCEGHEGWIVPPQSPESIKKILLRILSDPDQLSLMGARARVRAEREFAMNDFVSSTMTIYQASLLQRTQ